MSTTAYPCKPRSGDTSRHVAAPDRVLQGVQRKKDLIHRLIEGRLPLLAAAAEFQDIHRGSTATLERSLGFLDVPGDAEGLCRAVIGWAYLELRERPEQADAVTERLESELQRSLDQNGKIALPSRN